MLVTAVLELTGQPERIVDMTAAIGTHLCNFPCKLKALRHFPADLFFLIQVLHCISPSV